MHRVKVFDASVAFRTAETKPDYVLILSWNLRKEITSQLPYIRSREARFIVPIPEVSESSAASHRSTAPKNWSAEAEGAVEKIRATHEYRRIDPSGCAASLEIAMICVIFLPSRGSSRVCGSHSDNSWARQRAERVQFLYVPTHAPSRIPRNVVQSTPKPDLRRCANQLPCVVWRAAAPSEAAHLHPDLHLLAASLVPLRHRLGCWPPSSPTASRSHLRQRSISARSER